MNKILTCVLAALAFHAAPGFAADPVKPQAACLNGEPTEIKAGADAYIKKSLKPKCAANINIFYVQTPLGMVVAVNSRKGRNTFVASSVTGKFTVHKSCNAACTPEEAAAAVSEVVATGAV